MHLVVNLCIEVSFVFLLFIVNSQEVLNSATKENEQEIEKLTLDLDEKQKQITKLIKSENLNREEISQIVGIINNLTSIIYSSDGMKDQINELFLLIEQKDQEYKTLEESYKKVADESFG